MTPLDAAAPTGIGLSPVARTKDAGSRKVPMQVRSISLSASRAPSDQCRVCLVARALRRRCERPKDRTTQLARPCAWRAPRAPLTSAAGIPVRCFRGRHPASSASARRVSAAAPRRLALPGATSLRPRRCRWSQPGLTSLQPWTTRGASSPHPDQERTRPVHSASAARSAPAAPRRADGPTTSRRPALRPSRRRSQTQRQAGPATTMRQPGH